MVIVQKSEGKVKEKVTDDNSISESPVQGCPTTERKMMQQEHVHLALWRRVNPNLSYE